MNPLLRRLAAVAAKVGFYGFDALHFARLKPGSATAAEVRERLGAAAAEWANVDGGTTWEYPRGPEGTCCWMLTLDARGVLRLVPCTFQSGRIRHRHLAP